jgi:hypothetical protein
MKGRMTLAVFSADADGGDVTDERCLIGRNGVEQSASAGRSKPADSGYVSTQRRSAHR